MALPNVDQLNDFFGSLTLRDPASSDYEEADAIPATVGSNIRKAETHRAPLKIWARKQGITITGATERVCKELKKAGHLDAPEVGKIILALLAMANSTSESPVERLNRLLTSVSEAKVSDALISLFAPPPDSKTFVVGDLRLGTLDREPLVYWCNKVKCDHFRLHPDKFQGCFAIERNQLQAVQVLDLIRIAEELAIPETADLARLTDFYFHRLTQHRREALIDEFVRDQAVAVAMNAPYIVPEQSMMFFCSSFVSIYRDMGAKKKGYFCIVETSPVLDFAQADKRYPKALAELKDTYGFTTVTSAEIHQTLYTYCRFLLRPRCIWTTAVWRMASSTTSSLLTCCSARRTLRRMKSARELRW